MHRHTQIAQRQRLMRQQSRRRQQIQAKSRRLSFNECGRVTDTEEDRSAVPNRAGQYDWTEQIEVSKRLKIFAQDYETLVFAPYQTDASGEARFAKGILDAADAAYSLETWEQEDRCMTFNCVKMRSNVMSSFSSEVDWETLKIGPHSALSPKEREAVEKSMKTGEAVDDL